MTFLDTWRRRWNNTNVFRSLVLYDEAGTPNLLGPVCIDIDPPPARQSDRPDLNDAARAARAIVDRIADFGLAEDDLRAFFSGRGGFSIEILPHALGLSCDPSPATASAHRRAADELIAGALANDPTTNGVIRNGTVVERVADHDGFSGDTYLRLTDSRNAWLDEAGIERARQKMAVSLDELFSEPAKAIASRAAERAMIDIVDWDR